MDSAFRHAFDCLSPVCNCGLANEDNEHSSCTVHSKLSLKAVKMQLRIIGSCPNIRKIESQVYAHPSVSIGDLETEMIANTKYLGVQVDSQSNWDKHVNTIKTKANRALGLIKYSKKYLPFDMYSTKCTDRFSSPS